MRFTIVKRTIIPKQISLLISIFSVILALFVAAIVFLIYGVNPLYAYQKIFEGAFGSYYGISETLVKAIPLLICGLGLAIAFKAMIWNIGAEGQLFIGATAATWVALTFQDKPAIVILMSMFCVGFLGGAFWGVIPGILKVKLKTNEIITTLMMNYIAIQLVMYLVYGPWKGTEEYGFPYTNEFSTSAQLPYFLNTRIHYPTLIISLVLSILIYFLLTRTTLGYEIKVIGENPNAARYAHINYLKIIVLVMIVSGGLAGIAGVGEVAGIQHRLRVGISPGYGYTAIIVAWLSRLNPVAMIPVSILFGGLLVGGDAIQTSLNLPFATINMFNGLILFFILGCEFLTRYKIVLRS